MLECQEYCPRCQTLRTMRISVDHRSNAEATDGAKNITTRIYHCNTCLAFVRSEDISEEMALTDQDGDK